MAEHCISPHSRCSLCKIGRWVLMLLLAIVSAASAQADSAVALVRGTESYPMGLHVSYLKVSVDDLSLPDILLGKRDDAFVKSTKDVPNFGFSHSAYWFQLALTNRDSPIEHWLLESQYPLLDRIDVYLVFPDGRVVTQLGGDTLPFTERAIKHRNVIFKVPLAIGQSVRVYMRVATESSLQLPLVLRSPEDLMAKDHEEQFVLGLYYGVLLAMVLYNLMIFFAIRDTNFLYYVAYISGWMLFQMSLNGLAFEYLWPDHPKWGNISTPFFIGFANFFLIIFSRRFLQLGNVLPVMDRVLKIGIALYVLVMLAAFVTSYAVAIKLGTATALAITLVLVIAGLMALKRGVRQARYFMLAWTAFLIGIVLYTLKTFNILPSNFLTEYAMQIGSAFEVILLSFALAHRMRILREDNERIQREATEMLERRVQERTIELDQALLGLSDANEKLKELTHTDGLTGSSNRAYFDEQLAIEWQRAQRIESPIGLLMLDIDHFKRFNDTYGHLGGDACLRQVAAVIKHASLRPADKCFRYGGEEFAVLLPHTDLAGCTVIGERICRAVAELNFTFDGQAIPVTISVGVCAVVPQRDESSELLITRADQALYQAKRKGRDQVCVFSA